VPRFPGTQQPGEYALCNAKWRAGRGMTGSRTTVLFQADVPGSSANDKNGGLSDWRLTSSSRLNKGEKGPERSMTESCQAA
jgi:hypothetical protein